MGGPALVDQRRRPSELFVGQFQLSHVACDRRLAGDECLPGEVGGGLRLMQLRGGFGRVDPGDDLAGRNHVAFVRNDLDHPPWNLRRNVDLGRLDPAVDADDASGQRRSLVLLPGVVARAAGADHDRCDRDTNHRPLKFHGSPPAFQPGIDCALTVRSRGPFRRHRRRRIRVVARGLSASPGLLPLRPTAGETHVRSYFKLTV